MEKSLVPAGPINLRIFVHYCDTFFMKKDKDYTESENDKNEDQDEYLEAEENIDEDELEYLEEEIKVNYYKPVNKEQDDNFEEDQ